MLALLTRLDDTELIERFLAEVTAAGVYGKGDNAAIVAALGRLPPPRAAALGRAHRGRDGRLHLRGLRRPAWPGRLPPWVSSTRPAWRAPPPGWSRRFRGTAAARRRTSLAARTRGGARRRRRSPDRPRRDRRRRWPIGRWTISWPGPRPTAWMPSSSRRSARCRRRHDAGRGIGRAAAGCVRRAPARPGRRASGAAGRLAPGERRSPVVARNCTEFGRFLADPERQTWILEGCRSRPQPCRGQHPSGPRPTST